jgi:replicative DNA helicase
VSYDRHAEVSAVASALVKPETVTLMNLEPDDFRDAQLGRVYGTCRELALRGEVPDLLSVARDSGCRLDWLAEVVDEGMTANPESYAKHVRVSRVRREASQIAKRIAEGGDPAQEVPALLGMLQPQRGEVVSLGNALRVALDKLETEPLGTPTGFLDWDEKIGPLGQGHLVVVGARPAMGKTAFGINLALRVNGPTLFVSAEQPAHEIALRALAAASKVSLGVIKSRRFSDGAGSQIVAAGKILKESGIDVADLDAPTLSEVFAVARKQHFTSPLSLVVVDYLQRLKVPGKAQRAYEVGDNIQGLKTLARQLGVPVVVFAQVNRDVESRNDKRPHMADLKDSGIIEQEADVVAFLYRDEVYDPDSREAGVCEVCVDKNRHGPTGIIRLRYDGPTMRFEDYSGRHG